MSEEFLIHGPEMHTPIPEISFGQRIYNSLSEASPKEIAYVDAITERTLSHRELLSITCRLARAFQNCGYKANDVISISSENNLYFFVPCIASLYLGMITAPLNHNYTQRELLHCVEIAKPKIVFCSKRALQTFVELKRKVDYIERIVIIDPVDKVEGFETVEEYIDMNCEKNFSERDLEITNVDVFDHLSCILYSSGTSGFPKGVMITHDNIGMRTNHIQDSRIYISQSEVILCVVPFFHNFGFITNIAGLAKRNKIVVLQRFKENLFLKCIEKFKITSIPIAPPIMIFLAKSPEVLKYDLTSLKEITCGGAPLSNDLENAARKRFPYIYILRQGYGLTEATLAVLLIPAADVRNGSSGKVVPGMSAKIYDPETKRSLGPNQMGELCFKGRMVTKGYYGDITFTKSCFTDDGWVHTGDLAYYDNEEYFYIVDRLKELIKFKAFQVAPAELEAVLMAHPKIKDVGVIGKPDEDAGELATAFVVRADESLTAEEVKKCIADQLSKTKHLYGGVLFLDEIPKNPSGKILRRQLRKMLTKQIS